MGRSGDLTQGSSVQRKGSNVETWTHRHLAASVERPELDVTGAANGGQRDDSVAREILSQ